MEKSPDGVSLSDGQNLSHELEGFVVHPVTPRCWGTNCLRGKLLWNQQPNSEGGGQGPSSLGHRE